MRPFVHTHPRRLCVLLFLASGVALAGELRPPNVWEDAYLYIAWDMGSPELCAKIFPGAARGTGGMFALGHGYRYKRSDCYFDVAVKTRNAKLCDEVRFMNLPFRDAGGASWFSCRAAVRSTKEPRPVEGRGFFDAKPILLKMGYAQDEIPEEIVRHDANPLYMWGDFYERLVSTPDFKKRLDRLPDFSRTSEVVPSTPECEPPTILTQNPKPPFYRPCCSDYNENGLCDDTEPEIRGVNMDDVIIERVAGKPSNPLCGEEPLAIEFRLRNTGPRTIPRSSGWVEIYNLNPLAFGVSESALHLPIPEIPPGGMAGVAFPVLKLPDCAVEEHVYLEPVVMVAGARGQGKHSITFTLDVESPSEPRCVARRTLRRIVTSRGGGKQGTKLASDENVVIRFPPESRSVPIREGEPFEVVANVRNWGSTPLDAGSGFVVLGTSDRAEFSNRPTDLVRRLPKLEPGAGVTLRFSGLRLCPSPLPSKRLSAWLLAILCMREGCSKTELLVKPVVAGGGADRTTSK